MKQTQRKTEELIEMLKDAAAGKPRALELIEKLRAEIAPTPEDVMAEFVEKETDRAAQVLRILAAGGEYREMYFKALDKISILMDKEGGASC